MKLSIVLCLATLGLAACAPTGSTVATPTPALKPPAPTQSATVPTPTQPAITPTRPAASPTAPVQTPTVIAGASPTPTLMPGQTPAPPERNDPTVMMERYFQLISTKQYAEAYAYWSERGASPNSTPPDYTTFVNGYQGTATISVQIGPVRPDGAAGTIFFPVPIVLQASTTSGQQQQFWGCYLLTRTNAPIGNTLPPYPIVIRQAHIMTADAGTSSQSLLSMANQFVQQGKCTM